MGLYFTKGKMGRGVAVQGQPAGDWWWQFGGEGVSEQRERKRE